MSQTKRKPLFIGNWKMHFLPQEAEEFLDQFHASLDASVAESCDIALAPPHPLLPIVGSKLGEFGRVSLAAQNAHWEVSGAHTGEISPRLLSVLQVRYVLIGHSERRQFYGETNATTAQRLNAVLAAGMTPVLCVGETESEYRSGKSESATLEQLNAGLATVDAAMLDSLVIAYEPVWAIGTGLAATPSHAEKLHSCIRQSLCERFAERGKLPRILYGGSTKPENMQELAEVPEVDGALPGGSSLKPEVFLGLIEAGLIGFNRKSQSL